MYGTKQQLLNKAYMEGFTEVPCIVPAILET